MTEGHDMSENAATGRPEPLSGAEEARRDGRDAAGRFLPGVSGNPAARAESPRPTARLRNWPVPNPSPPSVWCVT